MTRPALSATWPLSLALATAIETEAAIPNSVLNQMLDNPPVYSGQVPADVALANAWIVLGASQENDAPGTFTRIGVTNVEAVDIWTADPSKKSCLAIVAELRRLLHRQPLALVGYGTIVGSFELLLTMSDPSRDQYHGAARYSAYSFNPA